MAIQLIAQPFNVAYNQDDILVTVQSTSYSHSSPNPNYLELTFAPTGSGPVANETLTYTWPTGSITITMETFVSNGALRIQVLQAGESMTQFVARFFEELLRSEVVLDSLVVTQPSALKIRIGLKGLDPITSTVTGSLTGVTTEVVQGSQSWQPENHSGVLMLFKKTNTLQGELITKVHGQYNSQRQITWNLNRLFPVKPQLPLDSTIQPSGISFPLPSTITENFIQYFYRIGDKFGPSPSAPEELWTSGDFYALHGGSTREYSISASLATQRLLHNYIRKDRVTFVKPVHALQPDWTYVFFTQAMNNILRKATVRWDDGTESEHTFGLAVTVTAGSCLAFVTGPSQLKLFTLNPGHLPLSYTWRLYQGTTVLQEVDYEVSCDCSQFPYFVAMDNGRGGVETVWMRGRQKLSIEVSRSIAQLYLSSNATRTGEFEEYAFEGRRVWEMDAGFHPPHYLQHISQLFYGKKWLIELGTGAFPQGRFLAVTTETLEADLYDDGAELLSMPITLKSAWIDKVSITP